MTLDTDRPPGRIRIRMGARAPDEKNRVSSSLELLFDLTFAVAIASITGQLAHAIVAGDAAASLTPFIEVFFAIWWAWMNFTWFASSFDTDDVPYRLLTLLQMGGVLVLAAGVPAAFEHLDFRAITLGYVIMRMALVAQWLRAAIEDPNSRAAALRYAGGITVMLAGWVARALLTQSGVLPNQWQIPVFFGLVACELAVPLWAERRRLTSWHPQHIAERYSLLTIILLGESVLAASTGVKGALSAGGVSGQLVLIAASGLILLFALWWIYFLEPAGAGLSRHRGWSFFWGYGHYVIFASLAALGAGLEVAVEQTSHHSSVPSIVLCYAVAIPVSVFLVALWAVNAPIARPLNIRPVFILSAAGATLLLPLTVGLFGVDLVGVDAIIAGIAGISALLIVGIIAFPVRRYTA